MKPPFEKLLDRYDYEVPKNLVAQTPAFPRDSARLLVYDKKTKSQQYDTFRNIVKYLPKRAVLVLNETKVIPARLSLYKETGGRIEVLYVATKDGLIQVMADHELAPLSMLSLGIKLSFRVSGHDGKYYFLKPSFSLARWRAILQKHGETPLPPYIKEPKLSERKLRKEYQSVFAKHDGSIAAPTASLHFTKPLLRALKKAGISVHYITLHVNLGTFASLEENQIKTNALHGEYCEISGTTARALKIAKKGGRPIIAVGTTVVRALETAAQGNGIGYFSGETSLFIREGYRFRFVDGMITNFHVPRSSLTMLVSALTTREKLFELYRAAIQKKFRFFSFGDGMLIT